MLKKIRHLVGGVPLIIIVLALVGLLVACSPTVPADVAEEEEQPAQETEEEPEVIYWVSTVDASSPGSSSGMVDRYISDMVREKSNGRLRIQVHWADELCSREDNRTAIKLGLADMGQFSFGYLPTSVHGMADLPSMGPSRTDQINLTWNELERNPMFNSYFKQEFDNYNMFHVSHLGCLVYKVMGLVPVRTMEDLEGLRIRVWGKGLVDLMDLCGAVPMQVSKSEMYGVLDTGLVDDVTHTLSSLYGTNSHEISDYFMHDIDLGIMTGFRVYNKDSYNALPEDLQAVLDEVAETLPRVSHYIDNNPEMVQGIYDAFKAEGIEWVDFEDSEELAAIASQVWDMWAERCDLAPEDAKKALAAYFAAKEKVLAEYPDGLPDWTEPFPWFDSNYRMFPD